MVCCPKCGSRNLRPSRIDSTNEKIQTLMGVSPLRCRDCRTRFVARTWTFADLAYARCPKCMRMDLATWSEKHFQAPNYMLLMLRIGGNPYRCEYCRYNFVSFRRRKERFSFRRFSPKRVTPSPVLPAASQEVSQAVSDPESDPAVEAIAQPASNGNGSDLQAAPETEPLDATEPANSPEPARGPFVAPDVHHDPGSVAEAIRLRKLGQQRRRRTG